MKEKFYLILSPINLFVMLALDAGCAAFGYIAVKKLLDNASKINIAFLCIMLFACVVAVLSTVQIFKNGVRLHSDRVEFTGIDSDNEFLYSEIVGVEGHKDTSASLRKNFVDRYSDVILTLSDGRIATVTLGLTTRRTLNKIVESIKEKTE